MVNLNHTEIHLVLDEAGVDYEWDIAVPFYGCFSCSGKFNVLEDDL